MNLMVQVPGVKPENVVNIDLSSVMCLVQPECACQYFDGGIETLEDKV
jgi:hypothetical protein